MVQKLRSNGVQSILDFAAEADPEHAQNEKRTVGRVYSHDIEEAQCDANVDIFLQSIQAAAAVDGGFAAIKITALGQPKLLEKMTKVIKRTREMFGEFDTTQDGKLTLDEFLGGLKAMKVSMSEDDATELFRRFDTDQTGEIDLDEWLEYLKVEDLIYRPFFLAPYATNGIPFLNNEELVMLENMMGRVNTIAECAEKHRVRLMVDAEQTYFQHAIDHTVMNLQRRLNREFPIVYNTYQGYLKDAHARMQFDLGRSRREGFKFACKVVRGAYMFAERERAQQMGYEDPIWPTIEDTHASYHRCLDTLFDNMDHCSFMVASHNQDSVEYAVQKMQKLGIQPEDSQGVAFGQLLGMSDNVSSILGANGYQAYKYVPYGPIKECMAYLVRRAEENSGLLSKSDSEYAMILSEIRRRFKLGK